jgi:hypothetical protein
MRILSGGKLSPAGVQVLENQEYGDDVEFHILGAGFKSVSGEATSDFTVPYTMDLYGGGLEVVSGTPHDEDVFSLQVIVPNTPEVVAAEFITDKAINGGAFRLEDGDCSTLPQGLKLRVVFKRGAGFASPANDYKVHIWYKVRKWV